MAGEAPTATLRLEANLDLKAAAPLKAAILAARGSELSLEAGDVRRLGGQCLQVLLAARAAWEANGRTFKIDGPSDAFLEAASLMGAATWLGLSPQQEPSA